MTLGLRELVDLLTLVLLFHVGRRRLFSSAEAGNWRSKYAWSMPAGCGDSEKHGGPLT